MIEQKRRFFGLSGLLFGKGIDLGLEMIAILRFLDLVTLFLALIMVVYPVVWLYADSKIRQKSFYDQLAMVLALNWIFFLSLKGILNVLM